MHRPPAAPPPFAHGAAPLLLILLLLSFGIGIGCGNGGDGAASTEAPAEAAAQGEPATPDSVTTVLVLGNSIAAGYGLGPQQAFPALLQQKADSLGWPVKIINAGQSGDTTAGGLRRLGWHLRQRVDVLLIELGGNDGLRGTPLDATRRNLQAIIDTTRARRPEARIILAGMQIPPNMGPEYTETFRRMYPELAEQNDVALIPFLLEDVAGRPELNQPDGIHPTAEGQRIVAENVWQVLRPILENVRQEREA